MQAKPGIGMLLDGVSSMGATVHPVHLTDCDLRYGASASLVQ